MPDYTVAISSDFFSAFASLPKQKQGRVMDFMSKFRSNPMAAGFNYEKINDAFDKNMRSVRVDESYRAIIMREDESKVFLLLWVDQHDKAYEWARRKRCLLNHSTGSIQVYEAQPEEATLPQDHSATVNTNPLFSALSDGQLSQLGVPEEQLPLVRTLRTRQDFSAIQNQLPRDAFEALDLILDGCDINEVIDLLYGESVSAHPKDLANALDNPITRMQFTVVEGEEELKAMMNAPLEKWRVFLHPSQRRLVSKSFTGTARVLGGAGTGKTVVAMHRARYLAQQCGPSERILFTTFTANLAQDIQDNLRKICTVDEMRRIEVLHLDAWVSRFLRTQNYGYTIQYDEVLKEVWEQASRSTGEDLDYPDGFFEDEWETVVQAQGITSLQEYAQAPRLGRGVRLDRKKRILIWKVFEEYRTILNVKQIRDSALAMNECSQILKKQPDYHPYRSIIVDEGQDLSMSAYKLLRALAGEERANDLFIVGDAHQRIYRNKVTLSKCGINIRGRSSHLKVNYRTTEEIRDWAMHILKGIPFDDLDGGIDNAKGYLSLVHGQEPEVHIFHDISAEVTYLVGKINEKIAEGFEAMDICIIARTNKMLEDYSQGLVSAGIRTYEIKRSKSDDRQMPGVRLATMHRVKGLEFTCVFIVGINKNSMPLKSAIKDTDPISKEESIIKERSLFYVALTRAKKYASISGYGQASEFIEGIIKIANFS